MLKLLAKQLANLGFADIISHQQAKDALVELEHSAKPVELIFCDLQMSEMDGVEFVRNLERIHYVGGLVRVSGEDQRILMSVEKLAKSHKLNVFGALHKPAAPAQLKSILADKLSHTFRPTCSSPRSPLTLVWPQG